MIMSLSRCYNIITYKTKERFTLTFISTPTPRLIFTLITFGGNHFYSIEEVYKYYYFKIWGKKMIARDNNGYIQSESEQVQFGGGKPNLQVGNLEVSKLNQVLPIWQSKCC